MTLVKLFQGGLSTFCAALCTTLYGEEILLQSVNVNDANQNMTTKEKTTKVQQRRILQDAIEKTEVVDKKEIEKTQSATLSEAIEKQTGVAVQNGCSVCGMKRVQLNGLTGDHTTFLVDGVPFDSTISSFYGPDAIGTSDIASIEVTRGAGASLTAPEAIGGVVNIIPLRPYKNGVEADISMGTLGTKSYSILGQALSDDKKTGILVSASNNEQTQVDRDNNGINESPAMKNQSLSIMLTHKFSPYDSLEVRGAHYKSDIVGGAMVSQNYAAARGSGSVSFINNNVNNLYTGTPIDFMEIINTDRSELYVKEHHIVNDSMSMHTTLAYSEQIQDSLYEGADYANNDKTYFADLKIDHLFNDNHFLTYGADMKIEQARSESYHYYTNQGMPSDDFNYGAYSLYAQDAWTVNDSDQLTMALRGVKIATKWLATNTTLDETLLVPRLLLKHEHNKAFTSRLSWGMGYRSPLTFFESDHMMLDQGFAMDISQIEKSNGANYSLAYNNNGLSVTASAAYTQVKNLAYVDGSSTPPILKNASEDVNVFEGDIVGNYLLYDNLSLMGSYEYYNYDSAYKSHVVVAPIEQRLRIGVDYDQNGWDLYGEATWVGSRNLSQYGYEGYDNSGATILKDQTAPSYVTVDLKVSKQLNKNFSIYAGAKNLFDYVQTDKQSPLFYDASGNIDVGYIWGPLRGRTVYAGVKATFQGVNHGKLQRTLRHRHIRTFGTYEHHLIWCWV